MVIKLLFAGALNSKRGKKEVGALNMVGKKRVMDARETPNIRWFAIMHIVRGTC